MCKGKRQKIIIIIKNLKKIRRAVPGYLVSENLTRALLRRVIIFNNVQNLVIKIQKNPLGVVINYQGLNMV